MVTSTTALCALSLFLGGGTAASSSSYSPWYDHLLLSQPDLVQKSAQRALEFGDFFEVPGACPASTTCPVVCVTNVTDCPTVCGDGLTLCTTGNCELDCTFWDDGKLANPCTCTTQTIACPKVVDLFTTCADRFQGFYDENKQCLINDATAVEQLSFTEPWFLVCYYWIIGVSVSVMLWCLYNEKIYPVATSTVPLEAANEISGGAWTQTGYQRHLVGSLIYLSVIFTFAAFQFLLFLLTIFFYMQQGAIDRWPPVFQDEIQVLKAFQIVWMVGIVWCLAFRYPSTGVRALFYRRCSLHQATHVAVVAPIKSLDKVEIISLVARLVFMIWAPIDFILRAIFSYPYDRPGLETAFCRIEKDRESGTRSILHRMRRYIYDETAGGFVPCYVSVGTTLGDFLNQMGGLTVAEANVRRGKRGPNVIPVPKPTILRSISKEFSKTFYLYQNFMVWSWLNFWYYYMGIVNTFVRVTGGLVVAYFQYTSDVVLYQLSHVEGELEVLRDGKFVEISVKDVVPGDVVLLKTGTVYCDMVVLKADRILVDESALTGEATPLFKTEIDTTLRDVVYNQKQHKTYTISAGTEIVEIGEYGQSLGLITTTGSFTTKGELLTEVLSYQRHKFQFDDDVKLVLFMLAIEAIFLVTLVFHFLSDHWVYSWFYGVFVLGTILPPLLPTVFVVSVGISAKRLQANRITCTYPEGILIAGKVDTAFFDKTGTLTKQGMDFISFDGSIPDDEEIKERIRLGMAVCHTLTTTSNGELVGNQVDKVSFESTGATIVHETGSPARISFRDIHYKVLKQYEFDSQRTTQSVIVEDGDGAKQIFVKGSPEVIKSLCDPSSLPAWYDISVRESAKSGIYRIAIAFRSFDLAMKMSDVRREDVEQSLTFGGFLNFENVMREETPGVVQELDEGDVTSAIITGDSVLTGICIAREAGIIKPNRRVFFGSKASDTEIEWVDVDRDVVVEKPTSALLKAQGSDVDLTISGEVWTMLCESDPKYVTLISKHVRVFGRCKPEEKVSVVATFIANGHKTLMCGDGQNDCGSLKTAHVGIALSSAEASIVAPFTSLDKTLTSVSEVLREGRCALASALAAYSYYIIYGQTETYLQTINAYFSITFAEWCWVFLDGIWSTTMAFTLPLAKAAHRLTPRRPTDSLLGPETIFSIVGILASNFLFLVIALFALWNQEWFQCRKWNSTDVSNVLTIGDNYESSVLFIVGGFQYISSAMALNFGYTFREGYFQNYIFVILSVTWTAFFFVMTIYPSNFSCIWRVNCDNENAVRWVTVPYPVAIVNPFNTTVMPEKFRWILVTIMAANFIIIMAWQYYFVNGFLPNRMKLASSNSLKNEYSEGGAEKLDGDFSEKSDKLTNGIVEELGVSIA